MNTLLLSAILAFAAAVCFATILNGWRQRIHDADAQRHAYSPASVRMPMVTAIVPSRNASLTLALVLQDLYAQEYPKEGLEVLVVDDGSTDSTRSIVQGMQRTWPALSLLTSEGVGKKSAITTGVQRAKGELIIMTDADARCGPLRVRSMVEQWDRSKADMLLGPVHTTGAGWLGKLQEDEQAALSAAGAGAALARAPMLANGTNMAFTRNAFTELGGYEGDPHMSGDDVFLLERMRRTGRTIAYVLHRDAVVSVEAERTFAGFWQQRLRWAGKMRGVQGGGKWAAAAALMLPWALLVATVSTNWTNAANQGLFRAGLLFGSAALLWLVPQITLTRRYMDFLGSHGSSVRIGISALCFALYAPLIAVASLFVRPEWRGRRL